MFPFTIFLLKGETEHKDMVHTQYSHNVQWCLRWGPSFSMQIGYINSDKKVQTLKSENRGLRTGGRGIVCSGIILGPLNDWSNVTERPRHLWLLNIRKCLFSLGIMLAKEEAKETSLSPIGSKKEKGIHGWGLLRRKGYSMWGRVKGGEYTSEPPRCQTTFLDCTVIVPKSR